VITIKNNKMRLFKPNSKKVTRILTSVKLALGTLAVSGYATNHDKVAFWLLASAGILDITISSISEPDADK
jgi:hypothetical protein